MKWTRLHPTPDPQHGTPCARSSHGVSLVGGGNRLLVYGGENKARTPIEGTDVAWIVDNIDSDKPSWRCLVGASQKKKNAPPDRIAHAQAVYSSNNKEHVYIFGGRAGITMNEQAMNDLWVLDCETETWSQVQVQGGNPPEARSFHRMICIGDSLYVFGGCGATSGRLADLHRFHIPSRMWHALAAADLRGRGGPNLVPLQNGSKLGVIAGFCGEESADGQVYDIATGKWDQTLLQSQGLRPRSVCASASFPKQGVVVIFGGEVDPSDRGHEGAGGFENDIVLLDETTGVMKETKKSQEGWPETRGWSDAACDDSHFYVFGGLSGDDANPRRLNDLWKLEAF